MIRGLDVLGAPKYRKAFLSIPREYAVRSFGETFGDFYPLAREWVRTGGRYLGVDLLWDDDHRYGSDSQMKRAKKMAREYQALAVAYPNADIELTLFTEHNLGDPDKFNDIVQEWAPNCTIVNNPTEKGRFSTKYKNEVHGTRNVPSGRYNYSGDGGLVDRGSRYNAELVDCDFTKLLQKHSNCERFYFWHARNNGKYSMKDPAKRPQRKYWPTPKFLQAELWHFTAPGIIQIGKGWTVKSFSEHHGPGETKGDELLLIAPVKAKEIVLKREDKVVKRLPYYGIFNEDGGGIRYRYYSGNFGYLFGANLEVYVNGKKFGIINGGFRAGSYRGKI